MEPQLGREGVLTGGEGGRSIEISSKKKTLHTFRGGFDSPQERGEGQRRGKGGLENGIRNQPKKLSKKERFLERAIVKRARDKKKRASIGGKKFYAPCCARGREQKTLCKKEPKKNMRTIGSSRQADWKKRLTSSLA